MSKRIPLGIREASAAKIVADVQPLDWSLMRHIEKNVACAKAELAAATALLEQLKTTGGDYDEIVGTKLRRG
jgi:hypothetical protein